MEIKLTGKRSTGRTERMVFDAVNIAIGKERFREAVILTSNVAHIISVLNSYFNPQIVKRIKVVQFELMPHHVLDEVSFKKKICRDKGWHRKQVFIDHYVIERYVQKFITPEIVAELNKHERD